MKKIGGNSEQGETDNARKLTRKKNNSLNHGRTSQKNTVGAEFPRSSQSREKKKKKTPETPRGTWGILEKGGENSGPRGGKGKKQKNQRENSLKKKKSPAP